jgi:hypothetical protein
MAFRTRLTVLLGSSLCLGPPAFHFQLMPRLAFHFQLTALLAFHFPLADERRRVFHFPLLVSRLLLRPTALTHAPAFPVHSL